MESEGREPYGVQYTSSTFLSHEGHYLFQSNSLCILSDFVNAAAFCFICSLQTGCRNHFVDREDVEESLEWHFKRCSMDICWDAKWCFPLVSRPPVKKVVRPYQVRVYHMRKKKSYSSSIFETRVSWEFYVLYLLMYHRNDVKMFKPQVEPYPGCQRPCMRGFLFRSSLKKWPARFFSRLCCTREKTSGTQGSGTPEGFLENCTWRQRKTNYAIISSSPWPLLS